MMEVLKTSCFIPGNANFEHTPKYRKEAKSLTSFLILTREDASGLPKKVHTPRLNPDKLCLIWSSGALQSLTCIPEQFSKIIM
jgi:hypothetical protein